MTRKPQTGNRFDSAPAPVAPGELGELYREALDYGHAEEEFQAQLATATESELAPLHRKIGECREQRGNHQGALESLRQAMAAARTSGDLAELGRASHLTGKVLYLTGDLQGAQECALEARSLLRDDPDIGRRGAVENLLGGISYRTGDLQRARRHFDEALVLGKDGQDLTLLSRSYNNLGLIHKAQCDWDQAIDCFLASLGFDSTASNYDSRHTAWINLGIVHQKRGDLREAESMFARAQKTCVEVGHPLGQVRSLLGMAGIHRTRRAFGAAIEAIDQAVELARRHSYSRELILADATRAWVELDRKQFEACRRYLDLAITAASRLSSRGELMCHLARLEASLALEHGRVPDALERATSCVDLATECGDRFEHAAVARILGHAMFELGQWKQATDVFSQAIRDLRRMGARSELAMTLLAWGNGEARRGDPDAMRVALDHLTEAAHLFETLEDDWALASAEIALSRIHLHQNHPGRAIEALQSAWDHIAGHPNQRSVETELAQLQKSIESQLLAGASADNNRVLALVELLDSSTGDTSASLQRFLDQVVELIAADGGLVACADMDSTVPFRAEAVTGLRVPERRAVLDLLEDARDLISSDKAANELVFSADPRGSRLPLASRLADIRHVGSTVVLPIAAPRRLWVLYLDRSRGSCDGRPFGAADLELLAALSERLPEILERLVRSATAGAVDQNPMIDLELGDLVCEDASLRDIIQNIAQIRGSSIRVLLQGETGTGKGMLARVIHRNSVRRDRPFRVLNCATLATTLLESELFGHLKGAFTGAATDKVGLLEEANGGTIFLDDIEKAGTAVQRGLLHFLDCGEIRPLGSTRRRSLDVRIICATSSADLAENVRAGTFSKDLYYRLHHFTMTVPPLRERRSAIPALAQHFIERFAGEMGAAPRALSPESAQMLETFDWPGNVRELENAMRRAVVMGRDATIIEPAMLPDDMRSSPQPRSAVPATEGTLQQQVEALEGVLVRDALELHGGNKSRAADALGLTRKGLRNKMRRYGVGDI